MPKKKPVPATVTVKLDPAAMQLLTEINDGIAMMLKGDLTSGVESSLDELRSLGETILSAIEKTSGQVSNAGAKALSEGRQRSSRPRGPR